MVSVYDFIRTAALVIGVGFTAQQDRKTWMWGDSVLWCAYAIGLFLFPGYLVRQFLRIVNFCLCLFLRFTIHADITFKIRF